MGKSFLYPFVGLLIPGLGQWIQGQRRKAVFTFGLIFFCFYAGLALDFDYYQRYNDIRRKTHTVVLDRSQQSVSPPKGEPIPYNPQNDPYVRLDNLPLTTGSELLLLTGRARPGLVVEVSNLKTGQNVQTQADATGFFALSPLPLADGENRLVYGAANLWPDHYGKMFTIADYDSERRYMPGRLDRMWHFTYKVIFPVLNTPLLHFSGGFWQSQVLGWWQKSPLTRHKEEMPAPIKDIGFYLLVLVAMFQLIALFDAFDTAYNREVLDDLP